MRVNNGYAPGLLYTLLNALFYTLLNALRYALLNALFYGGFLDHDKVALTVLQIQLFAAEVAFVGNRKKPFQAPVPYFWERNRASRHF